MVRVKRGNVARKRRKKILQLAKGYRGTHSRLFRIANQQVMKALRYSYVGRKQKKRFFRKLWITRINIAARALPSAITNKSSDQFSTYRYSLLTNSLKRNKIMLNRKMLAQLSILDPSTFANLVQINNSHIDS
jgi:large subunit ribosomal protein L20